MFSRYNLQFSYLLRFVDFQLTELASRYSELNLATEL